MTGGLIQANTLTIREKKGLCVSTVQRWLGMVGEWTGRLPRRFRRFDHTLMSVRIMGREGEASVKTSESASDAAEWDGRGA